MQYYAIKRTYIKPISEKWTLINPDAGDSAKVLADTLRDLGLIVDESAQFCRFYRYYEEYYECITYRVHNLMKITITINKYKYE